MKDHDYKVAFLTLTFEQGQHRDSEMFSTSSGILVLFISAEGAFCIDDIDDIVPLLEELAENPEKIINYKQRAYKHCRVNHDENIIRKCIENDFYNILNR